MERIGKYGKVYVREKHITTDGKEAIKLNLLESISFSNLEFKWYDQNGKLSPLNEKYKGNPFSLLLKLHTKDKNQKDVKYEGKVLLPFKLGHIGPQDFEGVQKGNEYALENLKKHGILPKDNDNAEIIQAVKNFESAAALAATCPGQKICDMKLYHMSVDAFFVFDDLLDNETFQAKADFRQSINFWSVVMGILRGKMMDMKKIEMNLEQQKKDSMLPHLVSKLIGIMREFREELSTKDDEAAWPVIEAYEDFFDAISFEGCRGWKDKDVNEKSTMFRRSQQELRLVAVGAIPTVEMVLFNSGIRVNKKIRKTFLFKYFMRLFSQHLAFVNDLMSYEKEMNAGTSSNTVYLFHVKDGFDLSVALDKVVSEINTVTVDACEAGELLINLYKGDEEVAKLVNACKGLMQGTLQWYSFTKRYGQDVSYDCIVELD